MESDLAQAVTGMTSAKAQYAALAAEVQDAGGGIHANIGTATREFRALFDELSSGRVRMVPGTLATIANGVFGISGAALAASAGVAVFVGGLGYLANSAIEAQKALEQISDQSNLLGRSSEISSDFIKGQVQSLSQIPGVSTEVARQIVSIMVAQDNMSASTLSMAAQLVPAYEAAFGKETREKFGDFIQKVNDLSPSTLKATADSLDLSASQTALLNGLLQTGNAADRNAAQIDLIGMAAQNAKAPIQNIDQQIASLRGRTWGLAFSLR